MSIRLLNWIDFNIKFEYKKIFQENTKPNFIVSNEIKNNISFSMVYFNFNFFFF